MVLNREQKTFMIEAYFRTGRRVGAEWQYSSRDCYDELRQHYPNLALPFDDFRQYLLHSVELFRETGSVLRKEGSGRPRKRTVEAIEHVRQIIDEAPRTSVRRLAQQVELAPSTCQTILKKDLHMYPYHMLAVQQLHETDYPQRVTYCRWFLNALNEDFLDRIFFTDEMWCYLEGYINSQNMRMWSTEKPNFMREVPLHPQKVGVWAALSRRRIVGPYFFEGTLNAERYREEILRRFFDELHEDELQIAYFQQDGATAHTSHETLNMIREVFGNRIISRNTPIPYPPRSCDLTPCDFFLWPYIKNSIFQQPIHNLDELRQRISEKINEINNHPNMLQNVSNSIRRRIQMCFDAGGGHFDHLL